MKKRIPLLLALCLMEMFSLLHAAYLRDIPMTMIQPNGDTLYCFASGDEYFNYLHDADGFTIIQNPTTGYYVYANLVNNKLLATKWIAGKINPKTEGLRPGLLISESEWIERRNSKNAYSSETQFAYSSIEKGDSK